MYSLTNYMKLFNHNYHIFINMFLFEFYKIISTIKCFWFVLTGKGTKGDYHLKTCASILSSKPPKEMFIFLFAIKLCEKLQLNQNTTNNTLPWFHSNIYFVYTTSPRLLEVFERYSSIETPKDALEFFTSVSNIQPKTIAYKIGDELYNKINEVDFKEAVALLS